MGRSSALCLIRRQLGQIIILLRMLLLETVLTLRWQRRLDGTLITRIIGVLLKITAFVKEGLTTLSLVVVQSSVIRCIAAMATT